MCASVWMNNKCNGWFITFFKSVCSLCSFLFSFHLLFLFFSLCVCDMRISLLHHQYTVDTAKKDHPFYQIEVVLCGRWSYKTGLLQRKIVILDISGWFYNKSGGLLEGWSNKAGATVMAHHDCKHLQAQRQWNLPIYKGHADKRTPSNEGAIQ